MIKPAATPHLTEKCERKFFGWPDAELKSIAKELRVDNQPDKTIADVAISKLLAKLVADMLLKTSVKIYSIDKARDNA